MWLQEKVFSWPDSINIICFAYVYHFDVLIKGYIDLLLNHTIMTITDSVYVWH